MIGDKPGIPLRDAEETVGAALADGELARPLGTRIGALLLAVERGYARTGHAPSSGSASATAAMSTR